MVSLRSIATAVAGAALLVESSLAHSIKRNALGYATLVEDADIETYNHRLHANSKFDLTFTLHNGDDEIRLQLEPNHDLFHRSLSVTTLDENGRVKTVEAVDRTQHLVFKGKAFIHRPDVKGWSPAGPARITVHRDGKTPVFEGSFRIDGNGHHIQTADDYQKVKHQDDPPINYNGDMKDAMVVWRDSDIQKPDSGPGELKRGIYGTSKCDSDTLDFNNNYHQNELRDVSTWSSLDPRALFGRQNIDGGPTGNNGAGVNLLESIGSTAGCPTTRKVALVGIATDCNYRAEFESDEAMRKSIISMVNSASEIYESTFNISLGIKNLTTNSRNCPGTPSEAAPWNRKCAGNIADQLNLFSAWRGSNEDSNAYWTLLTACESGSAVGLAWLGQSCRQGSSQNSGNSDETVAGANVVVRTSAEWQVFAHESGHTFGAVHDCTSSTCPVSASEQSCCPLSRSGCDADGQFIMNPSTSNGINQFSPCSIGNICSGFRRNVRNDCLTDNRNIDTIAESQCGNGIVESGEQCDCGGAESCKDNPCCDGATCKFKGSAKCDPTNEDCCTNECQFASSGTICRSSTGDCDPAERCPGNSATCPNDEHKKDGSSCGTDLTCASGTCTSRNQQCRSMMGNQTNSDGGDTTSCEDYSGCVMSCRSSDVLGGQCFEVRQNFLDGTKCAGGGHCDNGRCAGGSTIQEIREWLDRNRNIAIPVGVVIGILILLALLSCLWSCVRRCRSRRKVPKHPIPMSAWPSSRGANPNSNPNHNGSRAPPSYNYAAVDNQNNQYDSHYNNQYNNHNNPYPPPPQWQRQSSTRYA